MSLAAREDVRADTPSAVSLEVERVTKDFDGLRAVAGVSLRLTPGEIVGLIGPNGSGKTTLINLISGLLPVTNGRIRIGETDVTHWAPHQIARMGVARTFQVVRLFRHLTVLENVEAAALAVGRLGRRQARARAMEVLEELGLGDRARLPAGILPDGEERWVELARALVSRPRFLLLDEPGAGLTEVEVTALLEVLADLPRKYRCGILIVDHDMRLIMGLCDRLHVLDYGQTIAEGTPAEVRRKPEVIAAYLGGA